MQKSVRARMVSHSKAPLVLVALAHDDALMNAIVELANTWNWRLLDYTLFNGAYPKDRPLSGAIVSVLPDDPLVQDLRSVGCPIVRLGKGTHPLDHDLPAVLPDLSAAGKLAAQHFLERGFQHAAFIGWNPACPSQEFHPMFVHFRKAMLQAGACAHCYSLGEYHVPNEDPEARLERLQRQLGGWLAGLPKPIGILGYNDLIVAKLCAFFQAEGGYVPEEIALLGYGNSTWCHRSPVSLSSIASGSHDRALRAMQLLQDLMAGKPAPAEPILVPPAGLIKRRSTDILAMTDVLVAQALVFIWEHIQDPISVEDVAQSVGLSDRQLGRRFQQAIGRSVNQEIVRRRIDEVKRLLRSDSASIAEIASMTGYRSARYLHFAFYKVVGMTPGEYRKSARS